MPIAAARLRFSLEPVLKGSETLSASSMRPAYDILVSREG